MHQQKDETLSTQEGIYNEDPLYEFYVKRSNSRESERKSHNYREYNREDKEKNRDSYRDRSDFSRNGSRFKSDGMAGDNLSIIQWELMELTPFKKNFYSVIVFTN